MSQTYEGGPMTITASGTNVTTGAASANSVIPVDSAGNLPRYVRIAAVVESYVKLGNASVVATINDILVQPADAVVLAVNGSLRFAYIQGTATGKVSVVPLENM